MHIVLCLLVFCPLTLADEYHYSFINFTLSYSSTTGNCPICSSGRILTSSYTDIPQYSTLTQNFSSPLPAGYLLRTIETITLFGSFKTMLSPDTTVLSIFFGNSIVIENSVTITDDYSNSQCHACHVYKELSCQYDPNPGWWPSYYYDNSTDNSITVNVLQNAISLSKVTLTLKALDINPYVQKVFPSLVPVDNLSTVVTVNNNLYPDFTYKCTLSGSINATFQASDPTSPNTIPCNPPPLLIHDKESFSTLFLYVYPDTSNMITTQMPWAPNAIGPLKLSLYVQPVISSVSPNNGYFLSLTPVTIYGSGFFFSRQLACKVGSEQDGWGPQQEAVFIDSGHISCTMPTAPTYIQNGESVVIQVSQNGQSWTSNPNVTFTFYEPPFAPLVPSQSFLDKNTNRLILIVCGSIIGALSIAALIYLFWMKRKQRLAYRLIPDMIDSSVVINASELEMKERIGRGSFGDVYRAVWRYTEVAVKLIPNPSDALQKELYEEARLMATLRHPNIVTFMACTVSKPDLCIVTEFVTRGSLYKILHNKDIILEMDHIRKMAIDAAKGMVYLHGASIIHRDLKSHNLLVDTNWNVKVGDFGLSRAIQSTGEVLTLTACGTPCWTAPEVLRNQRYSFQADVYSFGICLWELVTRSDPYVGVPPYQVVIAVATTNLRPVIPKNIPLQMSSLIGSCWSEQPELRPPFGNIIESLTSLVLPKTRPSPVVLNKNCSSTNSGSNTPNKSLRNIYNDNNTNSGTNTPNKSKTPFRRMPSNTVMDYGRRSPSLQIEREKRARKREQEQEQEQVQEQEQGQKEKEDWSTHDDVRAESATDDGR